MIDQFGLSITCSDSTALAAYDRGLWNLMTLSNDPVADSQAAIAADPAMAMGHCLLAALNLLGTERALLPQAKRALAVARKLAPSATARERGHMDALSAFARGSISGAAEAWEAVLIDHPQDALAMYCAHQCDFFLGKSSELRDRPGRRLGSVDKAWPGYGFYRGMQAFGLEEMNQYGEAEAAGREAIDHCRRDSWAIHAVTHVMEMSGRDDEGTAFLMEREDDWARDNFFQCHNWWHLALYALDREDYAAAFALHDAKIRGGETAAMLDMIDASALLWRMKLHGADAGPRWQKLAAVWEARIDDGWYSFNDVHAMMAFAGAGDGELQAQLLQRMRSTAAGRGENALNTKRVSLPAAEAIAAYAKGRYGDAADLLIPIRAIAAQAGGSHAQRDVLNQTLIRAAEKAGRNGLAMALLNERLALKPASVLNRLWRERAVGSLQ